MLYDARTGHGPFHPAPSATCHAQLLTGVDRHVIRPTGEDTRTGYRAALRSSLVRRLWVAGAVTTVGHFIGLGALLFVAADRTGLAVGTAAVLAAGVLPSLLTGVLAGTWLDRFPRGRTLALIQLAGAGVVCLPLVFDGIAIVFVTAALIAAVRVATTAVRSGAMADGVDDDHRGPLVALLSTTDQAGQVVGYVTGGSLYVLLGLEAALLIDAAACLVAAAILAGIALPAATPTTSRPAVTAGLRDIARDPVLRLLAVLVVVTGTVSSLPETLAPSVVPPGDPWRAVVLAASPFGQAVTMTFLGRLTAIRRPSVQLVHFVFLALSLGLAALATTPPQAAAAYLLVGAGTAWLVGPQLTFLRLAPRVRMAHVTGTIVALLAVADGLGSLAFASLADLWGVSAAFQVAGTALILAAIVGWRVKERTPRARALDRDELPVPVDVPVV